MVEETSEEFLKKYYWFDGTKGRIITVLRDPRTMIGFNGVFRFLLPGFQRPKVDSKSPVCFADRSRVVEYVAQQIQVSIDSHSREIGRYQDQINYLEEKIRKERETRDSRIGFLRRVLDHGIKDEGDE